MVLPPQAVKSGGCIGLWCAPGESAAFSLMSPEGESVSAEKALALTPAA